MSFDFDLFLEAVTSSVYLRGAGLAVLLAALSQLAGICIGLIVGLWRDSTYSILRVISAAYVWVFRALPALLILILVWNALPQLFPVLKADWFSPFLAAFIGLAILEGALMAEIFRAAFLSIDAGQKLAGRALGFTPWTVLRRVLVPQMSRVAIPPTGNQFINMIKLTSLASVISLEELLTAAQRDVSSTFRYAEFYAAATVYYLLIVSAFMVLQSKLENRFRWKSSGRASDRPPGPPGTGVTAMPTTGVPT